jgi:hypothetical protein
MSWESPQFRTTSLTMLATGITVLFLSIALAYAIRPPSVSGNRNLGATEELPYLLPTLLGGLLTFVAGIRVSLFARPWSLVIGGTFLLLTSWFAPILASAVPVLKDFAWTGSTLLALLLLRILGLIFSTTGALRLLRREPTQQ